MASLSLFRPLQPRTVQRCIRFSTTTSTTTTSSTRAVATKPPSKQDRNLVASRSASPSYPPPSLKSLPRPKESRASRRTAYPLKKRHYPTRQPSHSQPETPRLIPPPVEVLPPQQCAPNLPYFVTRSPSQELPVYTVRKGGGSQKLTRIKRVDGNISVLRDELKALLGLDHKDAVINPVTKHIMLKGHHKPQIERYLRERSF